MRRGAIEYCVLALLRDGEMYGFELTRALAAADGLVTSEGTVYPLLARLRREGLVETNWQESSQGPPRRYYRLTEAGEAALLAFLVQWGRFRDTVDELLEGGAGHDKQGDRGNRQRLLPPPRNAPERAAGRRP
jgi:PadR family transcriptional regulator PadR